MEQAMWLMLGGGIAGVVTFIIMMSQMTKMAGMVTFLIERVGDLIETVEDKIIEELDDEDGEDGEHYWN